jgi:elongator complex protein 2
VTQLPRMPNGQPSSLSLPTPTVEYSCTRSQRAKFVSASLSHIFYRLLTVQLSHAITLEGHEDWVRCLSLAPCPSATGIGEDLLLASGSQDNYIRLWRIASVSAPAQSTSSSDANGLDLLDEFERKLAGEAGGGSQISTKAHVLSVQSGERCVPCQSSIWHVPDLTLSSHRYDVTLDALLIGHESGLTNVRWSPDSDPVLLSTASDNSLVIWSPSSQGIWVPSHRFGAIGGRGLSFYGAIWGPGGKSVMASGWNGGWERWLKTGDEAWEVRPGLTGHHGHVQSVAWDPRGDYLASVG